MQTNSPSPKPKRTYKESDFQDSDIASGRSGGTNVLLPNEVTKLTLPRVIIKEIDTALLDHYKSVEGKEKQLADVTKKDRRKLIILFFQILYYMNFRVKSVYGIRQKHLEAVFQGLENLGTTGKTINKHISIMRTFCNIIGKFDMVKEAHHYVVDKQGFKDAVYPKKVSKVHSVLTSNQLNPSSDQVEIDPELIYAKIRAYKGGSEKMVALWLEQCVVLGLNRSESVMLVPGTGVKGESVFVRTLRQGNRVRVIPIKSEAQRKLYEKAYYLSLEQGYLGSRFKTVEQKLAHFKNVLSALGITLKDEGITLDGIRQIRAGGQPDERPKVKILISNSTKAFNWEGDASSKASPHDSAKHAVAINNDPEDSNKDSADGF